MLSGDKWGNPTLGTGATVTWSLRPTESGYTALSEFMPVGYEDEIRAAFAAWSEVANVTFVEVPDTGPQGSDIRIGGRHIDGFSGTLASAYYPFSTTDSRAGDITFDTADPWNILPGASGFELSSDIFQVATHEIAHSIGMEHSVGVPSIVGASTSGYRGLLPADIAGAQHIYGPAAGYVAPPAANTTLTLTGNSNIQFSVTAFDGAIHLSDSSPLTGSVQAYLGGQESGGETQIGFRGGAIASNDMSFDLNDPLLNIDGGLEDLLLSLVSPNDLLASAGGEFDATETVLGLVNGSLMFDLQSALLGLDAEGDYGFYTKPLSLPILEGRSTGTLTKTPTGGLNEYDVLLNLPLDLSTTVDAAFLAPDFPAGQVFITIAIGGTIEAAGVAVLVPEPASWCIALAGLSAVLASGVVSRRRAKRS